MKPRMTFFPCFLAFLSVAGLARGTAQLPTEQLAEELERNPLVSCLTAAPRLMELISRPDFAEILHARRQSMFMVRLAMCSADAGEFAAAADYANRAVALDPESFGTQGVKLRIAMEARQLRPAMEAFEAVSRLRPGFVRSLDPYRINEIVELALTGDATGDSALRVFDVLVQTGWQQPPPYFDDEVRVAHARLLVQRGRFAEARARLAPVADVASLVVVRADNRFDALRGDPEFEAWLDLTAGAAKGVERARAAMEHYPHLIDAAYQYAGTLIHANRHAEAYEVARTSVQRYMENPAAFEQSSVSLGLMKNLMGSTLYGIGRADEAREVYRQAIRDLEDDPFGPSVRMNFANFLVGEGRAAEALETLSRSGGMSPWGQAWAKSIEVCAAVQLNDTAAAQETLEQVRFLETYHEGALPHALLCLNDMDGLAENVIRRLKDPLARARVLQSLQVTPATGIDEMPFMKAIREREAALRMREDVRQVVDAFGRIESIPVQVSGLY